MSVSQATLDIVEESVESTELATRNGFHLEPRCRVCRNDQLRKKVNDMLASGASYAMIVGALAADNAELDKRDRVAIDSIRNHIARHFPVQNVGSDLIAPRGINESSLVLLLRNIGDDLMKRSVDLWQRRVRAAQANGEVGTEIDPGRASEWIVRMLLIFELLPPMGVNLDSPRVVRRFVSDHILAGLTGAAHD